MKSAFIIYFNDQSAVVALASDVYDAVAQLDIDKLSMVTRVDSIPYPVL